MAQKYSNIPYFYTLLTDFIALLYPEICIGCSNALMHNDEMICFECAVEMPITHFEKQKDNPVERLFWYKIKIEAAASIYFFSKKSRMQKMIHSFKYKGNENAAIFLGKQLGKSLAKSNRFLDVDLIIPVPLHPNKLKKRGYNQAERIAQGMSETFDKKINTTGLIRSIHNETQTQKGLFNRWSNVKTIFEIANADEFRNKHILIVDDVITSGSTIEACAAQVLTVDNTKVSIVSLAVASG
jgi:ComF family protein